jgi:hypothetical protein
VRKYGTDKRLLIPEEEMQGKLLAYNKLSNKIQTISNKINTDLADDAAYNWGAKGTGESGYKSNVIVTTGTARATKLVGATGNRKAIAKKDLYDVYQKIQEYNKPMGEMLMVAPPEMVRDIIELNEIALYINTGLPPTIYTGEVGKLFGMIRVVSRLNTQLGSIGLRYSANGAAKVANTSTTNTHSPAALIFSADAVRYALGAIKVEVVPNAEGFRGGTVIDAWTRAGFGKGRTDEVGIISLVLGT